MTVAMPDGGSKLRMCGLQLEIVKIAVLHPGDKYLPFIVTEGDESALRIH